MLQKEIAGKNILFAIDNFEALTYDEYEFVTKKEAWSHDLTNWRAN